MHSWPTTHHIVAAAAVAASLNGCFLLHGPEAGTDPATVPDAGRPMTTTADPPQDGGSDAAGEPATPDGGPPLAPEVCAPMDARPTPCGVVCEDGALTFAWNGYRCVSILNCNCSGADCERTYGTQAECRRATAGCDARTCMATGGHWLPEDEYCGHHGCSGEAAEATCFNPGPACACGIQRHFVSGVGCTEAPELCDLATPEVLCIASHGRWGCDVPPGEPCDQDCLCPRGRVFLPSFGCVPDWPADCDDLICPIVDGELCDALAPLCADGLICCSFGRWGPRCGLPICTEGGDGCVAVE